MPTVILWVGGGLVLLLLGVGVVFTLTRERSLVEERLDKFLVEEPLEFGASADAAGPKQSVLTEWLNNRLEGSSFSDRTQEMLGQADVKLKVGEYFALILIMIIFVGILGFFIGGGFSSPGLGAGVGVIGMVVGSFVPRMYVKRQKASRLKRFGDQLPDMLVLMTNGLRAGYSTMQALEAVSKEMPAPINNEFRRVVQEMQLGITMETALDNLLRRIPSEDLDLVITAMNVQREVGGNLAEILETITHTIRERIRIKGEIKTLTAQVVYSGRFLSLLPVFVVLVLLVLNRDYMMNLFEDPKICGAALLCCSGIMIATGSAVMGKIADIEV